MVNGSSLPDIQLLQYSYRVVNLLVISLKRTYFNYHKESTDSTGFIRFVRCITMTHTSLVCDENLIFKTESNYFEFVFYWIYT